MSKQIITILDNYKVEIDQQQLNHTLYRYDEGGKEVTVGKYQGNLTKPKWEEIGFYPNLKQCLNKIRFLEAQENVTETLDKYLDRLDTVTNKLMGVDI